MGGTTESTENTEDMAEKVSSRNAAPNSLVSLSTYLRLFRLTIPRFLLPLCPLWFPLPCSP
jgi:hypothetical protein